MTSQLWVTIIVACLLLVFRPEVRKLVDWIVGFKRLAKTADGYSVEAGVPTVAPAALTEKREQVIVAAEPSESSPQTQATDIDPDDWVSAMLEKRYDDSLRLLETISRNTKTADDRVLHQSAIGYVKFEQNTEDGIAYFEELIREHPLQDEPYHWYALSYLWRELYDKALLILDRGLAASDRKWRLLDTKADCLVKLGRDDEAIAVAGAGVAADPSRVANYLNIARIYERHGDRASARLWFGRGVDASHGNEQALVEYARFLADMGEHAEAALRYGQMVDRWPKSPTYRTLLGNAYLSLEFHSHALQSYRRADELSGGEQGWILANIGNILNNRGFHAEGATYLRRALEKEPDSEYAHERLASAQKLEREQSEKLADLLRDVQKRLALPLARESSQPGN